MTSLDTKCNHFFCCCKDSCAADDDDEKLNYNTSLCCFNCCDFLPNKQLVYDDKLVDDEMINKILNDSSENTSVISTRFKKHVIKNVLLPYYDARIKYIANTQICWSRAGTYAFTISSVLVGTASILSFASGTYPNIHLNFVAGSIGLLALICKEFAAYSNTLDSTKLTSLNRLLKDLHISHKISDTAQDVASLFKNNNTPGDSRDNTGGVGTGGGVGADSQV